MSATEAHIYGVVHYFAMADDDPWVPNQFRVWRHTITELGAAALDEAAVVVSAHPGAHGPSSFASISVTETTIQTFNGLFSSVWNGMINTGPDNIKNGYFIIGFVCHPLT